MEDLKEMWLAAAEELEEITNAILDKFISGILWVINVLFLHKKRYAHDMSLSKRIQISTEKRIKAILPYKRRH